MEDRTEVVKRYIEDCIASERNFESQLRGFGRNGEPTAARALFAEHADNAKNQYERLEARLRAIGGPPSTLKSFMTHMFGVLPATGTLGKEDEERETQDLMIEYSVVSAEQAMYEVLASVANAAGDAETERLAREIQDEKRAMAVKIWETLAPTARDSFRHITESQVQTA